ncbi:XkdX family protein [Staphylococcus felis]|uniref:XkdX family protein n=1 Tax=Staphylococcus felis TaxID=46127 RepID=A0ABS0QP14_9STAP|nr:XkdX family protein [Staphylococcus felis]MBH9580871.1 XkdX family protein [Staphylococcus felis]
MFNAIKHYYELKLYTTENVSTFVRVNWITAEQFKEITGFEYDISR